MVQEYLLEHQQIDTRYLGTHYLTSCQWYGAYVSNQSLECLQITFAFDLCDLTLSRKRLASSEPAYRPSKEPFQESSYWTDMSNQSLHMAAFGTATGSRLNQKKVTKSTAETATTATTLATSTAPTPAVTSVDVSNPSYVHDGANATTVPTLPTYMRPTAVVVTCPTPRLTNSGMAEFFQVSSPVLSSGELDKDYEENIAPSMEVIRELENEEAEKERQLVLDSQTRREVEEQHQNQSRQYQRQLSNDIRNSMEAGVVLDTESEIRQRGFYESGHPSNVSSRKLLSTNYA